MKRADIVFAAAPDRGRAFAASWPAGSLGFCCVLAHTDTCMVPGLSAAGISRELRPLTPAADAEVVLLGKPRCLPLLPSHPAGAAGPSGITRAALGLPSVAPTFVGVGLQTWPATDCVRLSDRPGGHIALGKAVPEAVRLFEAGQAVGHDLGQRVSRVVIGESVPGGTTTALALLLALGYAAEGRVSGSMPGNARELKSRVARAALSAAGLRPGDGRADPLRAVSELGDPMQPVAGGMALGAVGAGADVLLAGGSQMIAVAALLEALKGQHALKHVAIGTTRWIVSDPAADVSGLAAEISPDLPILAANLDFGGSRHAGLRPYEAGLVKEGVGAGGACVAALLTTGTSIDCVEAAIDATYDGLLGRLNDIHPA